MARVRITEGGSFDIQASVSGGAPEHCRLKVAPVPEGEEIEVLVRGR